MFSYNCYYMNEVLILSIDYHVIGFRIRSARKEVGLTQEALAEKLDVTVGYISQIERGITKPNLEMIASIASVLGMEFAYFVTGVSTDDAKYMEYELTERIRRLSPRDRAMIISLLQWLENNEETK